jgi:hypothetical protein
VTFYDALVRLGACREARDWVEGKTITRAWRTCKRGDWLLWYVGRTCAGEPWSEARKPLVRAACECARLALPYTNSKRALACIKTAEEWTGGEATCERVRSTTTSYDAAAYAADAAAYADAASGGNVSGSVAAYAAAAANCAAYAVACADPATDVRRLVLGQCADIVRKHYVCVRGVVKPRREE